MVPSQIYLSINSDDLASSLDRGEWGNGGNMSGTYER